jgi:hypothetical protein
MECDAEKERLCDELDKQEYKIFMYGVDITLKEIESVIKSLDPKVKEQELLRKNMDVLRKRIMEKYISPDEPWRFK